MLRGPWRSEKGRLLGSAWLVAGVAMVVLFGVSTGSAWAARNVVGRKFGGAGSGAGQMMLSASSNKGAGVTERTAGSGVAVDAATGDVYVADTGNHRVDEFGADGTFVRAWGWGVGGGAGFEVCTLVCQAGASGSGPGEFKEPVYIAIDETVGGKDDVYVGDQGDLTVTKFTAEGVLVSSWGKEGQITGSPTGAGKANVPFTVIDGIAVNSAGVLDVIEWLPSPRETALFQFEADGAFLDRVAMAEGAYPAGLAVGAAGELFKANVDQTVEKLSGAGADIGLVKGKEEKVHEVQTSGLAVNGFSPDTLYVDGEEKEIEVYEFTSAGEVEEPGGGTCRVAPNGTGSVGCSPTESFGGGELSDSAGLAVDGVTGDLFVADAGHDRVVEYLPHIPAAPLVVGGWAVGVTEVGASVFGEVDPEGLGTEYFVEAGACGSPGTCGEAGFERVAGSEGTVGVENYHAQRVGPVELLGLRAGVTYHYRFVARNADGGPVDGVERVFTTRGTGSFGLPDERRYELVTPADKHGALIEPISEEGVVQAAGDGDAMTYLADTPTEAEPQGYQVFEQVLSTRGADGGWVSQDIEPPHSEIAGLSIGQGQEYQFFSEDLSHAVMDPLGTFDQVFGEEASPPASEQTPFVRNDFLGSEADGGQCTSTCYEAVVTGAPGYANVPEGTVFGGFRGSGVCKAGERCGPVFEGASADARHVVMLSGVALTSAAASHGGLYEWSAGGGAGEQLRLVSQFPPNKGGGSAPKPRLGWEGVIARNAISTDGERVVWEDEGHLYLRVHATRVASPISEGRCTVVEDACTIELDGGLSGSPAFQAAAADGERMFFTEAGNLYMYVVGTGKLEVIAQGAEVAGPMIQGVSEDGSWVYFTANGVLGNGAEHGATHGDCGSAVSTCNLYVWHEGVTKLVAILSGADVGDWNALGQRDQVTARVSPDGEWLAFMSRRSLTGYDNADAVTGEPDEEVFEYDAKDERVLCASCDPTGARPNGIEYKQTESEEGGLTGGKGRWPASTRIAASVPGMTPFRLTEARYQSRYLSDSGRLFFDSVDGLVPKDVNGVADVYEFEPEGVGSCTSASGSGSVVFVAKAGGCVGLISSGTSTRESAFMDASADGSNVFFLTASKLVPQDTDTALDIYDARECPVASECAVEAVTVPPACASEASCKAAPSPQPEVYGPSGSATFSGAGNAVSRPAPPATPAKPTTAQERAKELAAALKRCQRDRSLKKRAACVRAAHAKYGPASVKKTTRRGQSRVASSARRAR